MRGEKELEVFLDDKEGYSPLDVNQRMDFDKTSSGFFVYANCPEFETQAPAIFQLLRPGVFGETLQLKMGLLLQNGASTQDILPANLWRGSFLNAVRKVAPDCVELLESYKAV